MLHMAISHALTLLCKPEHVSAWNLRVAAIAGFITMRLSLQEMRLATSVCHVCN